MLCNDAAAGKLANSRRGLGATATRCGAADPTRILVWSRPMLTAALLGRGDFSLLCLVIPIHPSHCSRPSALHRVTSAPHLLLCSVMEKKMPSYPLLRNHSLMRACRRVNRLSAASTQLQFSALHTPSTYGQIRVSHLVTRYKGRLISWKQILDNP